MRVYPDDDYIGVEKEVENLSPNIEKKVDYKPFIIAGIALAIYLLTIKKR